MDEWNQKHHGQSGLIDRVKASTINEAEAERLTIEFLKQWVPENTSPICGNSVGQDRRCLLYTSDAADERSSVDLGGRRIIKKKKKKE